MLILFFYLIILLYLSIWYRTKSIKPKTKIFLHNCLNNTEKIKFLSDYVEYEGVPPNPNTVFFKNISKNDRDRFNTQNISYYITKINDKKNNINGFNYIYRIKQ